MNSILLAPGELLEGGIDHGADLIVLGTKELAVSGFDRSTHKLYDEPDFARVGDGSECLVLRHGG